MPRSAGRLRFLLSTGCSSAGVAAAAAATAGGVAAVGAAAVVGGDAIAACGDVATAVSAPTVRASEAGEVAQAARRSAARFFFCRFLLA